MMDKKCGNCANWLGYDERFVVNVLHYDNNGNLIKKRCAPCRCNAVEPNAGECIPLMTEDGNCQYHPDENFVPGDWYIEELEEQGMDEDEIYGLTPGVDYPMSMCKRFI